MAPRAIWKGTLKIAEVTCPVALHAATSTSDRIAFHMVNRATGHRVRREFVDAETGKPVEKEDQVKGYDLGGGEHVVLQPEEIAAAVPDSDKVLSVAAFVPCGKIDTVFFDRPYFLGPADRPAEEVFALIRGGLHERGVAAVARTVLFRRLRSVLVRAHGKGLIATTLNFDYEVRSAEEAFAGIPEIRIEDEMLDLARHIIDTKRGAFDPGGFDDRYEAALADLVRSKIEGKPLPARPAVKREQVVDLMAALRASAKQAGKDAPKKAPRRKAG